MGQWTRRSVRHEIRGGSSRCASHRGGRSRDDSRGSLRRDSERDYRGRCAGGFRGDLQGDAEAGSLRDYRVLSELDLRRDSRCHAPRDSQPDSRADSQDDLQRVSDGASRVYVSGSRRFPDWQSRVRSESVCSVREWKTVGRARPAAKTNGWDSVSSGRLPCLRSGSAAGGDRLPDESRRLGLAEVGSLVGLNLSRNLVGVSRAVPES